MKAQTNSEEVIWQGKSSQLINSRTFIYSVFMLGVVALAVYTTQRTWLYFFALYPVGRTVLACIQSYSTSYKLTPSRLIYRHGVFSKVTIEINLSQVEEVVLIESWFLNMFNCGSIELVCTLRTDFLMPTLYNAEKISEVINAEVQKLKGNQI